MLKGFLSKEKIVLISLIFVLLGLISLIFFRFQLSENGLVLVKAFYSDIQKSLNPSEANLTLDKTNLKIRFKISPVDQTPLNIFLKNLQVDNPGNAEISIQLGDQTAEFLNKILIKNHLISDDSRSINLNLRILSKEMDFDNKKVFGPFDSPLENLLDSPSDSGNIKVEELGESAYLIEINNPGKVLSEGTSSGRLKLSENLIDSKWWQIVNKLAKINLKIEDGVLTGAVFLK